MELQTRLQLAQEENQIDYKSHILLLGSCFVENMGGQLDYFKFRSLQNPFGILFQPWAIENLIARALNGSSYTEEEVFFQNERWHCYDAHSDLSNPSKGTLLNALNQGLALSRQQLEQSTHIVITLGSSWVYRARESGKLVANCHKVAQKEFEKELLSADEITLILQRILDNVKSVNKQVKVIFSVSPVRHLKDGFVENQRSKANLIAAIGNIMASSSEGKNHNYFPSYEIMMDELRDYRFYDSDMVHPNALAIAYIWEKFKRVWISETAFQTMDKIEEIQKSLSHRPFNPASEKHQKFLRALNKKIQEVQATYSYIEFNKHVG